MKKPDIPVSEKERLESLSFLDLESIADTEEFDFLTSLAADVCGCEISLISLIYEEKQWFLSNHGLTPRETPRDYSFCAHAIHEPQNFFMVKNASEDERFFDNPLVKSNPNIRFYSGVPILDHNGVALGTLCVIDQKPKDLNVNQLATLKKLADQVHRLFELRRMRLEEQQRFLESKMILTLLQDSQEFNRIGAWQLDLATNEVIWTDMVYQIHEVDTSYKPNLKDALDFYHPHDLPILKGALEECIENGKPVNLECRLITSKGKTIWVRCSGQKSGDKLIGSFQDITAIKENELKFKMMINSSSALLVVLDVSGTIVELNSSALDLAGFDRVTFVGKKFWDCNIWDIPEAAISELTQKFNNAIKGKETSEELVIWLNAEIPMTVKFSLKPIYDDFDAVAFIIAEAIPIQDVVDSRNRYKFVLEGANVATGQWNITNNEVIFDERWPEILGYSLEEIQPMSLAKWMAFYHPNDLPKCKEMLDKVCRGELEFFNIESRLKHKAGHWVWVHDKGKVLQWSQEGKPLTMYGIHEDISLRKEYELKLSYQENILNALFKNSPIGIVLNDFGTGEFLDVNQVLLDNLQYTKSEFLKLTYLDLTPEQYIPGDIKKMETLQTMRQYGPYQKEYIRKDGTTFPVILRGMLFEDPLGRSLIWLFIQDISKELEAEQQLKNAFLRLQTVLNTSTNVAFISTNKHAVIENFSKGAENLLGYSADEVVGKKSPLLFHDSKEIKDQVAHLKKHFNRVFHEFDVFTYKANQGLIDTRQWTYIRKDSARITVLLSVAAIVEMDEIVGYLGVATDISDIKKNEDEIRDLLELTQNQNERLQNFARIVSHNLKNHSDGILGVLELLREKNPELANNKFLSLFEKSANNLVSTINYLTEEKLLKSKLTELQLEGVDIGRIIQKNLISVEGDRMKIQMHIENKVNLETYVLGVPAYLDSAVLNILSNALKYSSRDKEARLNISSKNEGEFIILEFEDNGLGIDLEKHKNEVFALNKTFHGNIDSRGIGLFITKNQIEQMGGKIEVESEPRVGSIFRISLLRA